MLEHIANKPNLLHSVAICNGTWIFTCDPENKCSRCSGSLQDPKTEKSMLVRIKTQVKSCLKGIHSTSLEEIQVKSDEERFWLNGYVNKQNCRIWSEANPQVYVETPVHPEKLTVWCALWAGGILLQKR
ncbi:hypothetical protein TNCV_1103641 [Trichonephila clavipes]|nr:hypothetical protein TNCV_1103641 [Trichonephila clavipes]